MPMPSILFKPVLAVATLLSLAAAAQAAQVQVQVTIESLVPADSVSYAPLRVGFHSGSFDAFDIGQVAGAPIVSVAEGGSGSAWFPAFAAADPTATLGTVGGLLQPGGTAMKSFTIDTALNPFFTFAAMVVPSNDFFIGNDSPTEYRLFDGAGHLNIASIGIKANEIWDAGSEVFDPAAAAFVGNNDLRTDQHSVVALNFAELAAFNGLTTATGYVFNSQLSAETDVYRISFAVVTVPEPQTWALLLAGLAAVGWTVRRRRGTA